MGYADWLCTCINEDMKSFGNTILIGNLYGLLNTRTVLLVFFADYFTYSSIRSKAMFSMILL